MSKNTERTPFPIALAGRPFVNPVFDYMLIGGGLSLVVVIVVLLNPHGALFISAATIPYIILLSNSAHFAASTVRLYTKPGAYQTMPFMTMVLPLVALALLTLCILHPDTLGSNLMSLYLTWSPFHYAAQAYGLSVIYCYRSGCSLTKSNKKLLWWTSMLPFLYNFMMTDGVGLHWIVAPEWFDNRGAHIFLGLFRFLMPAVGVCAVVFLFWKTWKSESRPMPVISVLMLISNAIWWFVLPAINAFMWATIFHGIQYLAIVIIFHVKDQLGRADNRRGTAYHVLVFYSASLALGYGLFSCFPRAYIYAGFGPVESVLLVAAAINIHHFVVDAYIWRLRKTDTNRQIVDSSAGAPA